jgi:hypothetical protein
MEDKKKCYWCEEPISGDSYTVEFPDHPDVPTRHYCTDKSACEDANYRDPSNSCGVDGFFEGPIPY